MSPDATEPLAGKGSAAAAAGDAAGDAKSQQGKGSAAAATGGAAGDAKSQQGKGSGAPAPTPADPGGKDGGQGDYPGPTPDDHGDGERFRDAGTGEFVTEAAAAADPDGTVSESTADPVEAWLESVAGTSRHPKQREAARLLLRLRRG